MAEIKGTYHCGDCETYFTIESSDIVGAYEELEPTCPTCGTQNDIYTVES